MNPMKALYIVVFIGSTVYFVLYGIIMKKSPIITITYQKDSLQIQQDEVRKVSGVYGNDKKLNIDKQNNIQEATRLPTAFTELSSTNSNLGKMEDFLSKFGIKKDFDQNEVMATEEPNDRSSFVGTNAPKFKRNNLAKLMEKIDRLEKESTAKPWQECAQPRRVGALHFEEGQSTFSMSKIVEELSFVEKGGKWKPISCRAAKKVAIVVPFRDREQHRIMFLLHMHRFLRWQLLDYKIYIIEQSSQNLFNRGMLMNIGFAEAVKQDTYDCVIFHDVDLLPEDDRNDYSCPSSPRHMSTAVDTMDYKLAYKKIFGGVEAFWPEHFRLTNGFPNRYWGWGGEDDDLYVRVMEKKSLGLTRPAYQIGRYTMIKHEKSTEKNPERHRLLRESKEHLDEDGLNSLKYDINSQEEHQLYTLITVTIQPN